MQGKTWGKRSDWFAYAVIEATSATAVSVGLAAPPARWKATGSVLSANSPTARFASGAGAASFAAEEADAYADNVADIAAALIVGGAGGWLR